MVQEYYIELRENLDAGHGQIQAYGSNCAAGQLLFGGCE